MPFVAAKRALRGGGLPFASFFGNMPSPAHLLKPFVPYGDSLTAGGFATPYEYWAIIAGLVTGAGVYHQGIGSQTSSQVVARMTGADPTIVTPGLTLAEMLAAHVWAAFGRNDTSSAIGTTGIVAGIMANFATAVATITSSTYALIPPPTANIEPYGDPANAQCKSVLRKLCVLYPTRTLSWNRSLAESSNKSIRDRAAVDAGYTPASTRILPNDTENSLHFGRKGNSVIAREGLLWLKACDGGVPYAFPEQEVFVEGSAAATARTSNGLIATARFQGTPAACRLVRSTLAGAAIDSAGRITNAGNSPLLDAWYEFWFQGLTAGNVETNVGYLKVFVGASDTTLQNVRADGIWFATQPDAPTGLDSKKMSGIEVFTPAPGTDGQSMFLRGNENFGRFTIERNSSNRFRVIGKDNSAAPGTSVVVLQSLATGAGLMTAGIEYWVFWSFDTTVGTSASRLWVGDTSAKAADVMTSNATIFLNNRGVIGAQSQANANPFRGWRRLSLVARDYIDWGVQARRDEARAVLGSNFAINGIVPFDCFGGTAGDWAWGKNKGTGGMDFVTALPPRAAFA